MRSIAIAVFHVEREVVPAALRIPPFESIENEQQSRRTGARHLAGQALLALLEFRLSQHAAHVQAKDVVTLVFQ